MNRIFLLILILPVYLFAEHAEYSTDISVPVNTPEATPKIAPQGIPSPGIIPSPVVPPPQQATPNTPPQRQRRRYHMYAQQLSNSCWACSIKNVLAQYGIQKSEKDVVKVGMGGYYNNPINNYHMGKVVRHYGLPTKYYRKLSKKGMKNTLDKNYSVFAFVPGHVVVIQDMDEKGNIVVSDPAGGRTKKLPYEQFANNSGYFQTLVVPKPRTHQFQKGVLCNMSR